MKIIEYNETYSEDIKNLLVELQEYLVDIDDLNIQVLTDEYKEGYFKDMMELYKNSIGKIYLAIEDNKVLGFVFGIIEIKSEHEKLSINIDRNGRVEELCVTKDTRSKGIGTLLMDKIEEYFKENNCDYVYIEVFGPNKLAQNFYYKNGYNMRDLELIKKI